MKRISCSRLIILIFFVSSLAQSREWSEFYNNSRSNAMGGVKVAVSSDDTAVFRNPSNLGSFRGSYMTLLDPEIESSSNFSSVVTDIQEVKEILITNRDKFYHAKIQATPTYSARNFGIGLIYKTEMSTIMNTAGTTMDTIYRNDVGAILGYNFSFFGGRVKLGASAKMINRTEVDNVALDVTLPLDLKNIASEGTGLGGDLGLTLQAPILYFPTLAVVVHDIGNTKYTGNTSLKLDTNLRPQEVKQSVDLGISLMPIHSNQLRSIFSIEYQDLTDSRAEDFSAKRLHVGAEFNWNDILYFRLGSNQNYLTAGFEIATQNISWQLSTYGEEVGTKLTPSEDRRFSTKISVRF